MKFESGLKWLPVRIGGMSMGRRVAGTREDVTQEISRTTDTLEALAAEDHRIVAEGRLDPTRRDELTGKLMLIRQQLTAVGQYLARLEGEIRLFDVEADVEAERARLREALEAADDSWRETADGAAAKWGRP